VDCHLYFSHLLVRFYDIGNPALMSGVAGGARRSCHTKPAEKPTDETPLDERWYIPLFSVQSLYVVELRLSLRTPIAHQMHVRRMHNPSRGLLPV
jgi:hypothetical protein